MTLVKCGHKKLGQDDPSGTAGEAIVSPITLDQRWEHPLKLPHTWPHDYKSNYPLC